MTQPKRAIAMSNDKYHDHEIRINRLEDAVININKILERIEKRLDAIDARIIHLDNKIDSKWLLGFYIAGFSAVMGIMAHGFGWL